MRSEHLRGRDRARVEEIAAAVRAVPGCALLDVSSDASHNRSVLTLVGDAAGRRGGGPRALRGGAAATST